MSDLARFIDAQRDVYDGALAELHAGEKRTHWMWFVFPQIAGLGHSPTARFYAIRDLREAGDYLAHPLLGARLAACVAVMLGWAGKRSAEAMLGGIDAVKLRSSLTLFEVAGGGALFGDCLDAFYEGERDPATLALLGQGAKRRTARSPGHTRRATMTKTVHDLSEAMKDIDFCLLSTHAEGGAIGARPMSNNRQVDYSGDSWYFTTDDTRMARDIVANPKVSLGFQSKSGLLGMRPLFIAIEGEAALIRDKAAFEEHWTSDLDRWFEQGVDTPGLVLIEVRGARAHYWDGEDEGELVLQESV